MALVLTTFAGETTENTTPETDRSREDLPITTSFRKPRPNTAGTYLGSKRCRMCHLKWHDSWQERSHTRAWDALKAGNGRQTKLRANLDPQRDYTTDARCLACHTVGFGRPGGYRIPDPEDGKSFRAARSREGVGCESCHGPGSGFVQVMKLINLDMRSYQVEELHDAGLNRMGPAICLTCHNTSALCVEPGYRFDPETMEGDSFHAHFKLRYRLDGRSASAGATSGSNRMPVQ